ncbi:hypothetical protein [Frondihabitans australicus]|nr:hypothetical protein [Frondihabitans australicus]
MTRVDEAVTVWTTDEGVPLRLVWRAHRFRVSDVPTRLTSTYPGWQVDTAFDPAITHPPELRESWRFQGTGEGGETLVFDVSRDPWSQGWRLLRTYD